MTLLYQTELNSITTEPCPCVKKCKQQAVDEVYRFTKEMADANDFIPPAIKKKQNFPKCESYALSFFKTPQDARNLSRRIGGGYRTILSKLGTHISKLSIEANDGLCTKFNDYGHLDLHPFVNISFHTKITHKEDVIVPAQGVPRAP